MTLSSPYPYPGGKSVPAGQIWRRFNADGLMRNYVENFYGSGAVHLARPDVDFDDLPRETVNDADCFIANFWRAVQADPEQVADLCDWPVNEADLEARHKWIVRQARAINLETRCKDDPDFFDARIAGWWCWGLSMWIGGGWCRAYKGEAEAEGTGHSALGTGEGQRQFTTEGTGSNRKPESTEGNEKRDGEDVLTQDSGLRTQDSGAGGRKLGRVPERFVDRGVHKVGWQLPRLYGAQGIAAASEDSGSAGQGCSIGGQARLDAGLGVSSEPWRVRPDVAADQDGRGIARDPGFRIPDINALGGKGVSGVLVDRKKPNTEADRHGHGIAKFADGADRPILAWILALRARTRRTKVCCGDWARLTSPTATFAAGVCGMLLDPPYPDSAERDPDLYRKDCGQVAHDVRDFAIEAGRNPLMRIALCGYEGQHAMPADWEVFQWTAQGGYGNQRKDGSENKNRKRERIWFSPHCCKPAEQLFGREA